MASKALISIGAGAALLFLGAMALIAGAVGMAVNFQVPKRLIGLRIVAIGTSLPELFVSAVASLRGNDDVAVANVIGSNIFNIRGILGITAVVNPVTMSPLLMRSDVPWTVVIAFCVLPLMWPGMRVQRWKVRCC